MKNELTAGNEPDFDFEIEDLNIELGEFEWLRSEIFFEKLKDEESPSSTSGYDRGGPSPSFTFGGYGAFSGKYW